jgi:DNA-binding NarL/FixJ family response regulator
MALRVLLADDHQIVRQNLRALLEREGLEVVGEAADGREAVRLAETLDPEMAILDLAMPYLNGLDAARGIQQTSPGTKAILLTMHIEEHQILAALQAGIRGYVVKAQAPEELVQAIREVSQGGIYLSPIVSRIVVEAYLARIDPPRAA